VREREKEEGGKIDHVFEYEGKNVTSMICYY
jgi:hypothetical protein